MGTRSTIAVVHQDNSVSQIYCHWDGYLSHNGEYLMQHYPLLSQAEELVSFGDMSSLRENIHPDATTTHDFDNDQKNVCVFYGRDRGEEGVEARKFSNIKEFIENKSSEEYNYIFLGDRWYLMIIDGEVINLLEVTQKIIDMEEKGEDYIGLAIEKDEVKLLTKD